jgi:chromate transport protein ChrA
MVPRFPGKTTGRVGPIAVESTASTRRQTMDQHPLDTAFVMIAITCFTAPVAAAMLGYSVHYQFGLSRQEIRITAVVAAIMITIVIAAFLAIGFFFKRLREP